MEGAAGCSQETMLRSGRSHGLLKNMLESRGHQQLNIFMLEAELSGHVLIRQSAFVGIDTFHKPFMGKYHRLYATLFRSPQNSRCENIA